MLTKAQIKRRLQKIVSPFYLLKLTNRDFTIISNNCWGGHVYDRYSLQYRTPTIGLWIPPADYIKFLSNLDYYLGLDLIQINYSESHVKDLLVRRKNEGRYQFELNELILGRIDDVDIVFIHYDSFEQAKMKWDKRKQRVNRNNILIKMNDQNDCSEADFKAFLNLKYMNKLFFTANTKWRNNENVVFLKQFENSGYVISDTNAKDVPINITNVLNSIIKEES